MKPLDFTKPITTRDGRKVRILCTDGPRADLPVIGVVGEFVYHWKLDGSAATKYSQDDLINPPVKRKVEFWVNLFEKCADSFRYVSREEADRWADMNSNKRIACLHFTREYEEGEGL